MNHTLTIRVGTNSPAPRVPKALLEEAAKLGCKYEGIHPGTQPGNEVHSCYVFTFEDQRYEIPRARRFPLSRLRDLHLDYLRNHQPVTA